MVTALLTRMAWGLGAAALLFALDALWARRAGRSGLARAAVLAWACLAIALLGFVLLDHLRHPAFLNLMEGTILQHIARAAHFHYLYSEPRPDFVPFAYNPLYYFVAAPLVRLLGPGLIVARLPALAGLIGAAAAVYAAVAAREGRRAWGLIALGLFCASYRAMDTYLDTAHADSAMLGCALAGTWLLDRGRTRRGRMAGLLVLIAGFWFKQHGAWFVAGGLLYLTALEGPRAALKYWIVTALLGPGAYFALGPVLFGPRFFYYTLLMPGQWSEIGWFVPYRLARYLALHYPVLALAAAWSFGRALADRKLNRDAWMVQFPFACLTALLGMLDRWSADNIFIPLAVWLIVIGAGGLRQPPADLRVLRKPATSYALVAFSFVMLFYNPVRVMVPHDGAAKMFELEQFAQSLDGPVYMPSVGQFPGRDLLRPAAHWVALEDMIRGRGGREADRDAALAILLSSAREPGPSYILDHYKLGEIGFMAALQPYYTLQADLGDRFLSLRTMPGRFDHRWPRYLYRRANGAGDD